MAKSPRKLAMTPSQDGRLQMEGSGVLYIQSPQCTVSICALSVGWTMQGLALRQWMSRSRCSGSSSGWPRSCSDLYPLSALPLSYHSSYVLSKEINYTYVILYHGKQPSWSPWCISTTFSCFILFSSFVDCPLELCFTLKDGACI
jgi:hypothetical protein